MLHQDCSQRDGWMFHCLCCIHRCIRAFIREMPEVCGSFVPSHAKHEDHTWVFGWHGNTRSHNSLGQMSVPEINNLRSLHKRKRMIDFWWTVGQCKCSWLQRATTLICSDYLPLDRIYIASNTLSRGTSRGNA